MKNKLLLLFLSLIITFSICDSSLADRNSTTLFFPNVSDVESASGLIYNEHQTLEVPASWEFDKERNGTFITIKIPSNISQRATLVSGVVISNSQGLIMGPLTFADLPDPRSIIPLCPAEQVPAEMAAAKEAAITSLAEIRQRRVELAKRQLNEMADPRLLVRLSKLERGFGFQYKDDLTLDLPAAELAGRLDTLYHAISRYKFFRNR